MAEDRFKKGAREIVSFALNSVNVARRSTGRIPPRADVLIMENLGTLLPSAERERGINRALIEFNRGQLVDRIKEVAKDVGLKLYTVSPVGTSQVCSRCGALGRRYSIRHDDSSRQDIRLGPVEALFACRCGYRANADHNASINLHRRFLLGDQAVAAFNEWHAKSETDRRAALERLEAELLPSLRGMHELVEAATQAEGPF